MKEEPGAKADEDWRQVSEERGGRGVRPQDRGVVEREIEREEGAACKREQASRWGDGGRGAAEQTHRHEPDERNQDAVEP